MKPIIAILVLLIATTAGAGEISAVDQSPNAITITFPSDGKTTYVLVCDKLWCTQFEANEIISILERAKEFVEDNDVESGVTMMELVHYRITAQTIADGKAHDAAKYAERLKRETKLRQDIDAMLKRLK